MNLPSYAENVDSGVPWLGKVPAHWETVPARAAFVEMNQRNHPDEEMLSVTISKGVVRQKTLLEGTSKKDSSRLDRSAYKLVEVGDLVYNKMRAWQGAIGLSEFCGIVSPAYIVQRPRDGADPKYLEYLLRTEAFAKEAESWSYGIASDMWSLRPEHFRLIYICRPSLAEQAAIVRFLDHADRHIRRFIRNRRRLIEVLNEQKQAIISQAVTRGIDPNVRLKPSGVEWLGDVPEHWEVLPLGRIGRMFKGRGGTKQDNEPTGVPCVRYGDLYTKHEMFIESPKSFVSSERSSVYVPIQKGDVLFAGSGETIEDIGRSAVNLMEEPAVCGGDVIILRPTRPMEPRYLGYSSNIPSSRLQKSTMGRGFTVVHIYGSDLKNLALPVPPLPEQVAIVRNLDRATRDISTAIENSRREIALIQEYRMRLIADVVTGKVDVREAARHLQEEIAVDEEFADEALDAEALEDGADVELEDPEDANGYE